MDSDHEQKKLDKKPKRKHREKEEAAAAEKMDVDVAPKAPESTKKEKKRKSKDKKRKERTEDAEEELAPIEPIASPGKKHKRHKSEDKKARKHKHSEPASSQQPPSSGATTTTAVSIPDSNQYPFFTQTFSQRIPIWPAAFDEPLTKTAHEYLDPLLNRYSPKFKGVLLAYKNVNLSDRPRRANPAAPPSDETPVTLASFECYAPPFAWLTADLHLFVPARGAWMEGVINLQSEGHIGVVCFEKFNASIARRSLPRGWQWVEQEEVEVEEDPFSEKAAGDEEGEGVQEGGEGAGREESAPRLRSTGYWVDENGEKVEGKIYFRIKNFSSGSTGDYTYLSLQGTMLDDAAEKASATEEREMEKARRARQNPNGLSYPTMRIPESSMTKLKDITI
ncbi:unnamed protein product [Discula destructiva]